MLSTRLQIQRPVHWFVFVFPAHGRKASHASRVIVDSATDRLRQTAARESDSVWKGFEWDETGLGRDDRSAMGRDGRSGEYSVNGAGL